MELFEPSIGTRHYRRLDTSGAHAIVGSNLKAAAVRRLLDRERQRFAQDLHDQAGQDLALLRIGLTLLRRHVGTGDGRAQLEGLCDRLDHLGEGLHRMVQDLMPPALDSHELATALRLLLDGWSQVTGIDARLECTDDALPPALSQPLYRVVQEALTNIGKHGKGATRVVVRLSSRLHEIGLVVADDGPGLARPASSASAERPNGPGDRQPLGIRGMRERVARLGGRLRLYSPGHGGLVVCAIVPRLDVVSAGAAS